MIQADKPWLVTAVLHKMFYSVYYSEEINTGDEPKNNKETIIFMMDQWIVHNVLEILNKNIDISEGLRKHFLETLREIVCSYCVKKDTFLGPGLCNFSRQLLDTMFNFESITTDYGDAFARVLYFDFQNNLTTEIIDKVNLAITWLEKNDPAIAVAEKIQWTNQLNSMRDTFEKSRESLITCEKFVETNLQTCHAFTAVLGEEYFAEETLASADKNLPILKSEADQISLYFDPIFSKLEEATPDLFETDQEQCYNMLKSVGTETEKLRKKLASFNQDVSRLRYDIDKVRKVFDKSTIVEDLEYLTDL